MIQYRAVHALAACLLLFRNAGAQAAAPSATQRPITGEPSFLGFELDRLFRSDRRPDTVDPEARAEAGRIIMTGLGRRDIAADDRNYLLRLVSARTGLAAADADKRVAQTVAESKRAASQARASAIIIGFFTAASLAVGAAVAWIAAGIGGRHRDQSISPPLRWSMRRRTT